MAQWTLARLAAADTNRNITGQVKALDLLRDMLGFVGQQPGLAFHLRRRRISTAPHGCVKPRPELNLDEARRLMTRRSVALFVGGLGVYTAAGPENRVHATLGRVGGSSTTGSTASLNSPSRSDAVNRGCCISFLMLAIVVLANSFELFLFLFIILQ
jgi:hypothetical protein